MKKFDYKEFSENMALQAINLIPDDISDEGRKYLIKTIENFTYLAGEAIENDATLNFTLDNKVLLTQIVSEWTFHKSVDLARSNVPTEHWDVIMQKIAFTIFEITKQAMLKEVPQDALLEAVEQHVIKVWNESLEELQEKNAIDEKTSIEAQKLSNIDNMAETFDMTTESNEDSKKIDKPKKSYNLFKIFKCSIKLLYWGLALILFGFAFMYFGKEILGFILLHRNIIYSVGIAGLVIGLIVYFSAKKEIEHQLKELENLQQELKDLVNPDRMYERLGVDVLSLQVGAGLLPITDPDQDGLLLAKLAAMRQTLTDELGYIIPSVKIMDCSTLDNNDYVISVRNNKVAEGFVYPDKYMVIADEWESKYGNMPESARCGVDPCHSAQAYWLDKEQVEDKPNITAIEPADVIITCLKETVIKYVDSILTTEDINKYIELAKSNIDITCNLQKEDIRKIFVNLIREKISIKDFLLIFDRLNDFSRTLTDSDRLSEKIRQVLAQQICLKNSNESNYILAVRLSKKWQTILEYKLECGEEHKTFYFDEGQKEDLIETVGYTLMHAHQQLGKQPVILCPSKIRLPLYRLLIDYLPTVVVLSESEILPAFKVDEVGIIEKND